MGCKSTSCASVERPATAPPASSRRRSRHRRAGGGGRGGGEGRRRGEGAAHRIVRIEARALWHAGQRVGHPPFMRCARGPGGAFAVLECWSVSGHFCPSAPPPGRPAPATTGVHATVTSPHYIAVVWPFPAIAHHGVHSAR